MEVVYGPSSMGTTVTKADLAINAAKGSTGQQTETTAELTCFNIPHRNQLPTWWQVDDTGPFYSGRGSCSSGLELTHILTTSLQSTLIFGGLQVFDLLNRILHNQGGWQWAYVDGIPQFCHS